ncbi:acyl-CoA dehydratase activase [Thermodesulfobacteriota bacterium]
MNYFLGLDIGSLSCDAVIIDETQQVLASIVVPTGARNMEAIACAQKGVLEMAGIGADDIRATIATGYGRNRVEGKLAAVTEITCHARGIQQLFPGTRVLIDIGGQDSKSMMMDQDGRIADFAMNDKCAAGTGRFIEAMARALQVDISEMGDMDRGATQNLTLSSMCTVFAESEVVSLIAEGIDVNEIVAGLNRSIANRTLSLIRRVAGDGVLENVAMSGGVARNRGVVRAIGEAAQCAIAVPEEPDTVGAVGAALIALERSV